MRMRLWLRRMTISPPRMVIRRAIPWPLRWLLIGLTLGLSAALALWAFEFGRGLAGLDGGNSSEIQQLRQDVSRLEEELNHTSRVAHTAESTQTTDRVTQQQLLSRLQKLEEENRILRRDLGFYEKLMPTSSPDAIAIRNLQVDRQPNGSLKWQLLLVQPIKNGPLFQGGLEVTFQGTFADGKPWTHTEPTSARPIEMRQYLRQEGVLEPPAGVVVKSIGARLMQGKQVKSQQTLQLTTTK
jgi:hypothetical protein